MRKESAHPGRNYIASFLGHFWLQGPYGHHLCLVSQVLGPASRECQRWIADCNQTLHETLPYKPLKGWHTFIRKECDTEVCLLIIKILNLTVNFTCSFSFLRT